jgi:transcriptional regulator with XRE-family HTH domain
VTQIGNRLRLARAQAGMTLRRAEEETGLSKDTISRIERGLRAPQPLTAAKLAEAYGHSIEEFLEAPKVLSQQPERDAAAPSEALQEAVAIAWRLLAQQGQGIVERSVREGASRQLSEDIADYHADAARLANIRQAVGVQMTDELADAEDAYQEVENRIRTLLRQDIEDKQTQRLRVKKGERPPDIRGETA